MEKNPATTGFESRSTNPIRRNHDNAYRNRGWIAASKSATWGNCGNALLGVGSMIASHGDAPKLGELLKTVRARLNKKQETPSNLSTQTKSASQRSADGHSAIDEKDWHLGMNSPWGGIGFNTSVADNVTRFITPVQVTFDRDHAFKGQATAASAFEFAPKFTNANQAEPGSIQKNLIVGLNKSLSGTEPSTLSGIGFASSAPSSNFALHYHDSLGSSPLHIQTLQLQSGASDEARVPASLGRVDKENQDLAHRRGESLRHTLGSFIDDNPELAAKGGLDPRELSLAVSNAKLTVFEPPISEADLKTLGSYGTKMGFSGPDSERAYHVIEAYNSGLINDKSVVAAGLSAAEIRDVHLIAKKNLDDARFGGLVTEVDGKSNHKILFPVVVLLLPKFRRKTKEEKKIVDKKIPLTPEELRKQEFGAIVIEIERTVVITGYEVLFVRNRPPLRNDIQLAVGNPLTRRLGADYEGVAASLIENRANIHSRTEINAAKNAILKGWMMHDYANFIAANRSSNPDLINGLPDRVDSYKQLVLHLKTLSKRDPAVAAQLNHKGNILDVAQDDARVKAQHTSALAHAETLAVVADAYNRTAKMSIETVMGHFDAATDYRGNSVEAAAAQYTVLQDALQTLLEKRDETREWIARHNVNEEIRVAKTKLLMFREWHSRPEEPS